MQVAEKVKRKQEKKEAKKREKEMERRARNEDNEDGDQVSERATMRPRAVEPTDRPRDFWMVSNHSRKIARSLRNFLPF